MSAASTPPVRSILSLFLRTLVVVVGLMAWFWTQQLLGLRDPPERSIGDSILELLESPHRYLQQHDAAANALLVISSAVIDVLGVFLLVMSIFGPTVRPFLGLLMLFVMRQICQSLCALEQPQGMIWRDPGLPSLLVTYKVATDFFFSGHTGLAVLGSVELVRFGGKRWVPVGILIIFFESLTVLVLRAHYFMDVFTGAVVAGYVSILAARWAPWVDHLLARGGPSPQSEMQQGPDSAGTKPAVEPASQK